MGCEGAIHLARSGRDVTVIEMPDEVAPDATYLDRVALMVELGKNIKVLTGTEGKAVIRDGLVCVGSDGKEKLYEADTIICAVGQRSLTTVVDQLRDSAPELYCIGECVKPQKVTEAIRTVYDTAMNL